MADGHAELLLVPEVVIVNGLGFEMAPVALDEVEFGRIGGVPDRCELIFVVRPEALQRLGGVDRAVVEKDEEVTSAIAPEQEFQKGHEVRAPLAFGQQDGRFTRVGVEPTEDGHFSVAACRRDERLLTHLRPNSRQAGIEMEFAFVPVDEGVASRVQSPFFKASSRAHFARRTCRESCLCFNDSFGRL